MKKETQSKAYKISYTDGRADEIFELEAESECKHDVKHLGDVPPMTPV